MKFELHQNAAATFNEQACVLTENVTLEQTFGNVRGDHFRPDIHVSAGLNQEDLRGPLEISHCDNDGKKVNRFIQDDKAAIGFNEKAYAGLRKLAESIQKTNTFRKAVSIRFIEDSLFHWSLQKIQNKTQNTACEYIIACALKEVKVQNIWIPVYGLNIQSPFCIGSIKFQTITRFMIDDWQDRLRASSGSNPQITFKLDNDKKQLLGFAAASCEVEADPSLAVELGTDLAEKATSILRLFSPANFDPQQFSYCVPLGSHQRYGSHHLIIENSKITNEARSITTKGHYPWVIDDNSLHEMHSAGLSILGALFGKEAKTPFEETVLEALFLYSKAALVPTLAEKLLYMFASLESLLLKDEREPITEAISERLAYLTEKGTDPRIAVRQSVKQAYNVRSRFVHHGRREDIDLTQFFIYAWTGLINIAGSASTFKTKQDLLNSLERYKYRS